MNSYLFLFTISPVQSFIEQARKTRDLYAGSKLLSTLIDFAMDQIPNPDFIFPSKTIESKPNRFIAKVELKDDNTIKKFGEELEVKVKEKFKSIALNVVNQKTGKDEKELPKNYIEQINNHLQIHWAALQFDDKNYKKLFRELESNIGSIKNIRAFNQTIETGRKCSLCGERNVLFYGGNKPPAYTQSDAVNISDFSISSGEGLCAVCFLKRFYLDDPFPSTAEIALMESLNKLYKINEGKTLIDNYKKLFGNDYDHQLYYEENLTKNYFDKQNINANDNKLNKAKDLLSGIRSFAQKNNIKLPGYYAVIMFDGDSMGKWLSGLKLKDDADLTQFHKTLSLRLGEFADSVRTSIPEPKGRVVYAGGEDFLGFINLNHLFEVLKLLRELFDSKVNQAIKSIKKDENDVLSFSAGIVIAHYKIPLSEVLKWARAMEKEAKKIDDNKNAFSIAVLKHSGEINKAVYKWSEDKGLTDNLDALNTITTAIKNDNFSTKFINNICDEFSRLINSEGKSTEKKHIMSELYRLLKRACKIHKEAAQSYSDFINRKTGIITKLSGEIIKLYSEAKADNFFYALNISAFISRHLNGE